MSAAQGETLFEAGAQADNLYFVVRGAIELTADEGFRYLHPRGDLVGGPAAFCHALPEYRLSGSEGPDHRKMFTIEVIVNGEVLGSATGRAKKEAEQEAARLALDRLENP